MFKNSVEKFYIANCNITDKKEFENKVYQFINDQYKLYKEKRKGFEEDINDYAKPRLSHRLSYAYYRDELLRDIEHLLWYKDYHENVLKLTKSAAKEYVKKYKNICDINNFNKFIDLEYEEYLKTSKYINNFGLPPTEKEEFKDILLTEIQAYEDDNTFDLLNSAAEKYYYDFKNVCNNNELLTVDEKYVNYVYEDYIKEVNYFNVLGLPIKDKEEIKKELLYYIESIEAFQSEIKYRILLNRRERLTEKEENELKRLRSIIGDHDKKVEETFKK